MDMMELHSCSPNVRTMANAYIGVCDMCDFFIEKARLTTHLAGYA